MIARALMLLCVITLAWNAGLLDGAADRYRNAGHPDLAKHTMWMAVFCLLASGACAGVLIALP